MQALLKPRWGFSVSRLLLAILCANFSVDLFSLFYSEIRFARISVFILQSFVFLAVLFFKSDSDETPERKWSIAEVSALMIFAVAWVVMRATHIDQLHFWLDEYTQLQGTYVNNVPVHMGLIQQQPPGSYILIHALGKIFGLSILTSKLLALIPSAMAFILFSVWARGIAGLAGLVAVAAFLTFDDRVLFHSIEGRGIGLAIMWGGFLLVAGKRALKGRTGDLVYWSAGVFFFLMSLGLQPPLLMLGFFVGSLLVGWVTRERVIRRMTLMTALAFVVFSPVMLVVLIYASNHSFLQFPSELNRPSYVMNLQVFGYLLMAPGTTLIVLCSSVLALFEWKRSHHKAGFLIVMPLVVAATLTPLAFSKIVSHPLQFRYLDIWRVLLFTSALVFGLKFIKATWVKSPLIIILIISFWYPSTPANRLQDSDGWRYDWQKLYQTLASEKYQDGLFHASGVCFPGAWCYSYFIGHEFQTVPAIARERLATNTTSGTRSFYEDNGIIDNALLNKKVRWGLVIPMAQNPYSYQPLFSANSSVIEVSGDDHFMIIITREVSSDPVPMLEEINRLLPDVAEYYRPLEMLYRLHVARGEAVKAKLVLDQWSKLAGHEEAVKQSPQYSQKWQYINAILNDAN